MSISSKKRRIAYLCLEAPREGQASYVHMNEIVRGLHELGWDVDVFVPAYSDRWHRPSLIVRILEHHRIQLRMARRMSRYQLLYIRGHPLGWLAAFLAKLGAKPVLQEVNGTFDDLYLVYPVARYIRRAVDAIMRAQYRTATAIVAVTPGIVEWLEGEVGPDCPPVAIIPNGANPEVFSPNRAPDSSLSGPYVTFVGAQTPWHDLDVILGAIARPEWPQEVKLVLVGACSEADTVKLAAARNPRIVLKGRVSYDTVGSIVASALAGLVAIGNPGSRSSVVGVSPLKLFETMACGIPLVASDLPYQAQLVEEAGAGLLFPPGDSTALAKAVGQLARNPKLAAEMGRRGREAVLKRHTWQQRAADTDTLLQQMLAGAQYTGRVL